MTSPYINDCEAAAEGVNDVDVIVVGYRSDAAELDRLFDIFGSPIVTKSLSVGKILVQNDDLPTYARAGIQTITGHGNVGFGAGVRIGVENSRANWLLIVNPDCAWSAAGVLQFMNMAIEFGEGRVSAPVICKDNGSVDIRAYADWTITPTRYVSILWAGLFFKFSNRRTLPRGMKLPGAALMLTRPLAERLGPFDPAFFLYGEDRDLSRRARKEGLLLEVDRDSAINHTGGGSGKAVPELVKRSQADSAIEIGYRRYGSVGTLLVAIDLLATGVRTKSVKIRSEQIRRRIGSPLGTKAWS